MRRSASAPTGAPGLADLGLCVAALLWGTAAGTGLAIALLGAAEAGDLPMLSGVIGSAFGGACGLAMALYRVGPGPLGLRRPAPRWIAIAIACLPPFIAASALWTLALERWVGAPEEQQIVGLLREQWGTPSGAFVIGFALLGAPLFEEGLFRGVALPALVRPLGRLGAVLATALTFGALHGADPESVPPLILLGLALGWLRLASGSLWPCVALHLANNALVLLSLAADPGPDLSARGHGLEHLGGVALDLDRVPDPRDPPVGADQEGAAHDAHRHLAVELLLAPDAPGARDGAVHVRHQREGQALLGGEALVAGDGVAAHADDQRVGGLELRGEVAEVARLDGAARGGVAGVEVDDDGAAGGGGEVEGAGLGGTDERGRRDADLGHGRFSLVGQPNGGRQ